MSPARNSSAYGAARRLEDAWCRPGFVPFGCGLSCRCWALLRELPTPKISFQCCDAVMPCWVRSGLRCASGLKGTAFPARLDGRNWASRNALHGSAEPTICLACTDIGGCPASNCLKSSVRPSDWLDISFVARLVDGKLAVARSTHVGFKPLYGARHA